MADSVTERSESKEKVRRDRRQSSDVFGEGAWISAHHDPVASLYTFTSCIGRESKHCHLNYYYYYYTFRLERP